MDSHNPFMFQSTNQIVLGPLYTGPSPLSFPGLGSNVPKVPPASSGVKLGSVSSFTGLSDSVATCRGIPVCGLPVESGVEPRRMGDVDWAQSYEENVIALTCFDPSRIMSFSPETMDFQIVPFFKRFLADFWWIGAYIKRIGI